MKIVKADRAGIREAVGVLKSGGVIAYPTETTYGLGCDPRDATAVRRIFRIKGRDEKKPMLLVAASAAQVKKVAVVSGISARLAKRYWPGPLTLVLPIRREGGGTPPLPKTITPRDEIAIRVSSSPIVQRLTRRFGFPIVSTSANRSGKQECRSGKAIEEFFSSRRNRPDLIIDGGTLPKRKPSTIARVKKDGTVDVLREGSVKIKVASP
jgi:L-threonylcarbamoyladenylate synthase